MGGDAAAKDAVAKVLLFGMPRSGKTSISKVVFGKMPAHETMFLETTVKLDVKHVRNNSLVQYDVCDFPAHALTTEDFLDSLTLTPSTTVVFVIDAQDQPYVEALQYARRVIIKVYARQPATSFDIFVHKVDGDLLVSDENLKEIHTYLTDDMSMDALVNFHCTSIYDHSVFEAMSQVVQKLFVNLPIVEQLLSSLCGNSRIEQGLLFDVVSKLYIASDSSNVDLAAYELCSDMIDVVIDISCIYTSDDEVSFYDSESSCIIQLKNGMLLYLKQVEKLLAFACLIREENFDRQHLLDYNINIFRDALKNFPRTPQVT